MQSVTVCGKGSPLRGELTPPGDKSISHRAIIMASLATGVSSIKGILKSQDVISTATSMKLLGVGIEPDNDDLIVTGKGLHGLKEPGDVIDAGNSGTTARLLTGLLSAQNFFSCMTGDKYLRKRPMARVIAPLTAMGADIRARSKNTMLPIAINGSGLRAIRYDSPVSSAQVKSAIMLAGLYADGTTEITEPYPSRDHTERMFSHFGINISSRGSVIRLQKADGFNSDSISVPSDISSAAYFIVAALINPGSELLLKNIGVNTYRTGIIDVLNLMGAGIQIQNLRNVNNEPVADITVKSGNLSSVQIGGELIPRLIDEIPVIAVAACFAEGITTIKDASELRVKETDRIKAMVTELTKMGAKVEELEDGMIIEGTDNLRGALCDSWGDHRIAMSLAVAATRASDDTTIDDSESVGISYPDFFNTLARLRT